MVKYRNASDRIVDNSLFGNIRTVYTDPRGSGLLAQEKVFFFWKCFGFKFRAAEIQTQDISSDALTIGAPLRCLYKCMYADVYKLIKYKF